jgi:hypothetical protein
MMIPITAEYNRFEIINVLESQLTNLASVVIRVGDEVGYGQFLSEWKKVKKGEIWSCDKETEIVMKVIDKINMRAGDDVIFCTKITWEDMCRVNNEMDNFDECELKLLWNVNITHNILSWDKSCSTCFAQTPIGF